MLLEVLFMSVSDILRNLQNLLNGPRNKYLSTCSKTIRINNITLPETRNRAPDRMSSVGDKPLSLACFSHVLYLDKMYQI